MDIEKDLLVGVRVLDLSSVLAGPLTASCLSELGATVTKVENKNTGGDATRQWKLPDEDNTGSISAYYASANHGKEVILLDLQDKADYAILIQQVAEADIIITNFQKRTAEKLRIDFDTLVAIKPDLIVAQLNAYTYEDPRPGYDLVMQAEAGWISMTGSPDGILAKMPVAMIDMIASHQLRMAVMGALLRKYRSGQGSWIHVSLYQSAISALANQASNFLMNNHVPRPMGTLHPNIAPYGDLYTTKDHKTVMLAIGSDIQFEKLGKTLNFAANLRVTFMYNRDRVIHRRILNDEIQQKMASLDLLNVTQLLSDANVPYCVIKDLQEVFENNLAKAMVLSDVQSNVRTRKVSSLAWTIVK